MDRLKKVQGWLLGNEFDAGLPAWRELPFAPGTTLRCAWSLFDKPDGKKDELGTLNLLTPDRVLAASRSEIRTGRSVSLK